MELLEHNRQAAAKVRESFLTHSRAAVIHATGTGKSFIIEAVCKDYRNVLVLAPNNYVLGEIRKRDITAEYRTYPWLLTQEKFPGSYDLIVLDEFHRGGAQNWGSRLQDLLDTNPDAKILGTTATEIRYLDSQRNMADELFEGNVVSRISLPDAWAAGILPVPKYVIGLYAFEKVYDDLVRRLKSNRRLSEDERVKASEVLKKSTLNWEDSHGITTILKNHLPKDTRKMIVFCERIDKVEALQQQFISWMSLAGLRSAVYTVHSKFDGSQSDMTDFEKDECGAVKVLFAIDMLNEGIHVPDVDAIVMLRCTSSRIIQLQQMGRCMSVGQKTQPVIFDLVDNLSSSSELDELKAEYKRRIDLGMGVNSQKEGVSDFTVFDYVKDFRDVVNAMKELRPFSIEDWMQELREWVETTGCWPKNNAGDEAERRLASFASRCRRHPLLIAYKEELTQKYGMVFIDRKDSVSFEVNVGRLREFLERELRWPEHKNDDEEENDLRTFVTTNMSRCPEKLEPLRLEMLERYGFDLQIRSSKKIDKEQKLKELTEFVKTNGKWPGYATTEEASLATFACKNPDYPGVQELKDYATENFGTKFRKEKKSAKTYISLIEDFIKEYGRWPVYNSKDDSEKELNLFLYTNRNNASIDELRRKGAALTGKDISFKTSERKPFEERMRELELFVQTNHRWPASWQNADKKERSLHIFAKKYGKDSRVSDLLKKAQEEYGFQYQYTYDPQELYPKLLQFVSEHGCWPDQYAEDTQERQLFNFAKKMRLTATEEFEAFCDNLEKQTGFRYKKKSSHEEKLEEVKKYIEAIQRWPSKAKGDDESIVKYVHAHKDDTEIIKLKDRCEKTFGHEFRKSQQEREKELTDFVETYRRWPSGTAEDKKELSLNSWTKQNTRNETMIKCREIARRYEKEDAEKAFTNSLTELEAYVKERGKWPSHHVDEPLEKQWGRFVHYNRKDKRIIELKKKMQKVSGVKTTADAQTRMEELRDFVRRNHRMPSYDATDPQEATLYHFVMKNKYRSKFAEEIQGIVKNI